MTVIIMATVNGSPRATELVVERDAWYLRTEDARLRAHWELARQAHRWAHTQGNTPGTEVLTADTEGGAYRFTKQAYTSDWFMGDTRLFDALT